MKTPEDRSSRRGALVALLLLVPAALVAGCTSGAGKSSSAAAGSAPAGDVQAARAAAVKASSVAANGAATAKAAAVERSIVSTASVDLRATDVNAAATAIITRVTAEGGRVESDQRSDSDKERTATLVLQVPPARLNAVIADTAALGHVTDQSLQADDVTTTRADVTARVAALSTSVRRLSQLLSRSADLSDLVKLENVLTARQSDLDAMRAREAAIAGQVALAALTVNLSTPAAILPAAKRAGIHPTGFGSAIASGFHAVVVTVRVALAVVGYALPAALPVAVVVVGFVFWRRRRVTRRPGQDAAPTPA